MVTSVFYSLFYHLSPGILQGSSIRSSHIHYFHSLYPAAIVQIILFYFLAIPCGLWDLISLTRDGTRAPPPPAVEGRRPNHYTTREFPVQILLKSKICINR